MTKEFDPRRLDVRRFAEEGGQLRGAPALREFSRLIDETEGRGADGAVEWQAEGEVRNPRHVQPQAWLHLQAKARLPLLCQRCLTPVEVEVEVDRSFRFVADEAAAEAEDEAAEEDVLAESHAFDLLGLVEDELLMDMPTVPRHVICPVTLPAAAGEAEFDEALTKRENPFAALAKLKNKR